MKRIHPEDPETNEPKFRQLLWKEAPEQLPFLPNDILELICIKLSICRPIKPALRSLLLIGSVSTSFYWISCKMFQKYFSEFRGKGLLFFYFSVCSFFFTHFYFSFSFNFFFHFSLLFPSFSLILFFRSC